MGIDCILAPGGHHSESRLRRCGSRIITSLAQLPLAPKRKNAVPRK
jgi:hypothetical protein